MPRATDQFGRLAVIQNCKLVCQCGTVCFRILPDISDSKGAYYAQENAIGRSQPITTFGYSEPRMISTEFHFMITTTDDINENWQSVQIIKSLVYPGAATIDGSAPYTPPPVARFVCGSLVDQGGVCVILKNYSLRWPTDVAWETNTLMPFRFSISCQWQVVNACVDLPNNNCTVPCELGSCEPYTGGSVPPLVVAQDKGF